MNKIIRSRFSGNPDPDLRELLRGPLLPDYGVLKRAALNAWGSFSAIVDLDDGEILILTDAGGSVPVFYARAKDAVVAGFQAETVASESDNTSLDLVSAADFVINERVCFPFSIFKGVFQASPGSLTRIDALRISEEAYYLPEECDSGGSVDDWGARLREITRRTLDVGLAGATTCTVLFSGGEDARAVAMNLPARVDPELAIFTDGDNRETALAQRAADAMGLKLRRILRPPGYYRDEIQQRADMIGYGVDVRHTHAHGPVAESLAGVDALCGGYKADSLFKTCWMENVGRAVGGLGTQFIYKDRPNLAPKHGASEPSWLVQWLSEAVDGRRTEHERRLKEFRPSSARNWSHLWPMSQGFTYGHYLSCLQIGPKIVEPFLGPQAYRYAAELPDRFRLEREAFRRAFYSTKGRASWIPTSSGKIPALGNGVGRVVELGIWGSWQVRRKGSRVLSRIRGERPGSEGAWPSEHFGFAPPREWMQGERFDELCRAMIRHSDIRQGDPLDRVLNNEQRLRLVQLTMSPAKL